MGLKTVFYQAEKMRFPKHIKKKNFLCEAFSFFFKSVFIDIFFGSKLYSPDRINHRSWEKVFKNFFFALSKVIIQGYQQMNIEMLKKGLFAISFLLMNKFWKLRFFYYEDTLLLLMFLHYV